MRNHSLVAPRRVPWSLCAVLALATAGAVLATAWISDDAFVTFRTVENFVAGEGLRWNVADRCQTATHPLWVLLLAAARVATGELYFTTIALGVLLSALAILLVARTAPTRTAAIVFAGLGALGSKSFVEFGTCGLENPLVYLLVALFAQQWFCREAGAVRLRHLGTLGALLVLARQDLVLLVLPCLVAAVRGAPWRVALRALLPGALLALAWYLFALVYYGTVIPTPGYGKLVAADVPARALFTQGRHYLADLGRRDPVAAGVLVAAVAAGLFRRQALFLAPALGVLLQVAYTLRVGGDFMSGRFFTAAFVLALATAAQWITGRGRVYAAVWLLAAMFAFDAPPWLTGTPANTEARIEHGIGNERAYYAEDLGLWSDRAKWAMDPEGQNVPRYEFLGRMFFHNRTRPAVVLVHAAGVHGYLNGSFAHLVDPFLCDPLLMRLPLQDREHWRIGHFKRRLPEGYLETLASGENRIRHAALAKYHEALQVLLRAPVFSAQRWRVWWGFQRGEYDGLLADYVREAYHEPPLVDVAAAELPRDLAVGTHWYDSHGVVVREGGLRIRHESPGRPRTLRLLLDGGGAGVLVFERAGQEVGRMPFLVAGDQLVGARWFEFAVPEAALGFDRVTMLPRVEANAEDSAIVVLGILAVLGCDLRP